MSVPATLIVPQKWPEDQFLASRPEVLAAWPTGAEVDLDEAVRFHQSLPEGKIFSLRLREAQKAGVPFTQPRAGVAVLREHIELLRYLQNEGQADFLPTTIDSYTRQNRYADAQKGVEESLRNGRSLLNGLPAVNYGVSGCRQIITQLDRPVQVRHGTPDPRLLAEITLAAGFTSFEGGGVSYNIPYAKDVPVADSVRYWQYVDRLVGWYEDHGVSINREPFGPLTGTLVPPCISHAIGILEALLAAEQGVRDITLGYGQCGNVVQDVAAMTTLVPLAQEYLDACGFKDVTLSTVFHQWMGGFPPDEARAYGVISVGSMAAFWGRATKVIVKTPQEAVGIPTKEANAAALRTTRQVMYMLRDQPFRESPDLEQEREILRREVHCLVDRTLALGEGNLAAGVVRAFAAGVLDVPFAPSRHTRGKLMPVRDNRGAVRLLDFGMLPIDPEIQAYHREKIAERGRVEGRKPGFQMVIDDIYAISKGMLVGRPR